jgi:uncharacterized protein with PIN domain
MAFATCDRCKNACVLGDDQTQDPRRARCPFCSQPLRITSREEFFARLNREEWTPPSPTGKAA